MTLPLRHCWILLILTALLGCSGPRQQRMAYDALRTEYLNLESAFHELAYEYEVQSEELESLRDEGFDPSDDSPPRPMSEPGSLPAGQLGETSDPPIANNGLLSRLTSNLGERNSGTVRRRARNMLFGVRERTGSGEQTAVNRDPLFGDVISPDINLPAESMSADEFMEMLEQESLSELPQRYEDSIAHSNDASVMSGPEHFASSSRDASRSRQHGSLAPSAWSLPESELSDPPRDHSRMDYGDVSHIVINSLLTRGRDFDGLDGDDGLAVVIEPRDAEDLFVPRTGNVVISLIDPFELGEAQRVGFWELSSTEVARRMRQGPTQSRGIHLLFPWPNQPPAHRNLKLFVRFIDASGNRHESSIDVVISLVGDGTAGWSVRNTPRQLLPEFESNSSWASSIPGELSNSSDADHHSSGPVRRVATQNGSADEAVPVPKWSPYR